MEITRKQAIERLEEWKRTGTTLGLCFAARGGTAASTILARITQVSSRITFKNQWAVLHFGLYKALFERSRVQVLLWPSREGIVEVDGLHIWLESGHWLFICDPQGIEEKWLDMAGLTSKAKGPGGLLEGEADAEHTNSAAALKA